MFQIPLYLACGYAFDYWVETVEWIEMGFMLTEHLDRFSVSSIVIQKASGTPKNNGPTSFKKFPQTQSELCVFSAFLSHRVL